MKWEGHGEMRNEYEILIGNPERKGALEKHKLNGRII
jgi:hypothetical protein